MDLHADATFLPALAAPSPKLRALALRCLGLRALNDGAQVSGVVKVISGPVGLNGNDDEERRCEGNGVS